MTLATKRNAPEGADSDDVAAHPAKRVQTDSEKAEIEAIEAEQEKIDELDKQCAKEQMAIQRKFDAMKKPLFKARQALVEKIPHFWGTAISRFQEIGDRLTGADEAILQHLTEVELDDNIDSNGSYKISFTFADGAKEYFEPSKLEKTIFFSENTDDVAKEEGTTIVWKVGKRPTVESLPEEIRSEIAEIEEDGDILKNPSVLDWFDKQSEDCLHSQLGEFIRRAIFHQPLVYFNRSPDDDEDDEDEDDEDEEDQQDGEPAKTDN